MGERGLCLTASAIEIDCFLRKCGTISPSLCVLCAIQTSCIIHECFSSLKACAWLVVYMPFVCLFVQAKTISSVYFRSLPEHYTIYFPKNVLKHLCHPLPVNHGMPFAEVFRNVMVLYLCCSKSYTFSLRTGQKHVHNSFQWPHSETLVLVLQLKDFV